MATVINRENSRIMQATDEVAGDKDSASQTDLEIIPSNVGGVQKLSIQSVDTYKHRDDLCKVLQSQSCASDAKLLMFAAAANSAGYRSTLVPLPPLFKGKTFYDIKQVRRVVATWSSCNQMLLKLRKVKPIPNDIHLLHWVLVTQENPILRRYKMCNLSGLCKDLQLIRPTSNPQEVLSVQYKDERRKVKSKPHYAYLGCPLQFLYRLLIMGRMDNLCAGPLRLYHQAEPALAQCTVTKLPIPSCWSHSRFGRAPRCVLICEVLQEKLMPQQQLQTLEDCEIIIYDTSCLRIRYLLIFTEINKSVESLNTTLNNGRTININSRNTTTRTINSSSPKSKFNGNINSHRFRGNRGSRWIFRIVGWIMGRVVRIVQHRRTTF